MDWPMLVATSLTVSVDAFFAGFSAGIGNKNNNALLAAVAVITYLFCLAACLLGNALSKLLDQTATYFGAAILIVLGICNLLERQQAPSAMQCIATGVSVALDGAAAALSLSLQNVGNAILTPVLFAATHLFAVFLGKTTAKTVHCAKANVLSAITLFILAAIRLAEL